MVLGRSRIYTLRVRARGDPFPGIPPPFCPLSFSHYNGGKENALLCTTYTFAKPQKHHLQPEIINLFVKERFYEYFQAAESLTYNDFTIIHRLYIIYKAHPMHPLYILCVIFGPFRHPQSRSARSATVNGDLYPSAGRLTGGNCLRAS